MRALAVIAGGLVFGVGLALSTMTKQEVVLSFLQWQDFGLMLVMGGGIAVTALTFWLGPRVLGRPRFAAAFQAARNTLDWRTLTGAAIFGVGWGLSGLCPGSAIASLGTGNFPVLVGLAGMFVGAALKVVLFDRRRAS